MLMTLKKVSTFIQQKSKTRILVGLGEFVIKVQTRELLNE